jgi:RecJ-like exonuclease
MKTRIFLSFLAITCAAFVSAETSHEYSVAEASKHVGQAAQVSGKVEEVRQAKGGSIFLNLGGKHPSNPFTVFIPKGAAGKFPNAKELEGKTITVSGKIQEHEKKVEIVVTDPAQITKK